METRKILGLLRNPFGSTEAEIRAGRLAAADFIEFVARNCPDCMAAWNKEVAKLEAPE